MNFKLILPTIDDLDVSDGASWKHCYCAQYVLIDVLGVHDGVNGVVGSLQKSFDCNDMLSGFFQVVLPRLVSLFMFQRILRSPISALCSSSALSLLKKLHCPLFLSTLPSGQLTRSLASLSVKNKPKIELIFFYNKNFNSMIHSNLEKKKLSKTNKDNQIKLNLSFSSISSKHHNSQTFKARELKF